MIRPNKYYSELKDSYLFYNIAQKTKTYVEQHPGTKLLRMGIGDVSLPLCDAVIRALHEAVDDQASKNSFHGYMPECGAPFLREKIAEHYEKRGVSLAADEVFVSSGICSYIGQVFRILLSLWEVCCDKQPVPHPMECNRPYRHRGIFRCRQDSFCSGKVLGCFKDFRLFYAGCFHKSLMVKFR